MKKRSMRLASAFLVTFCISTLLFGASDFLQSSYVSKERLMVYPIPEDYRCYFFLQSIDDTSMIIIGDFTGAKKLISQIIDANSDNKVDQVFEYYPDQKLYKAPKDKRSRSQYFKDDVIALKKSIIDGSIFRDTYSYRMKSMETIDFKLKEGTDIRKDGDGWRIVYMDPDSRATPMSDFYFAKLSRGKEYRYDLVFRTNYYTIYNAKIVPPLEYSVYCRNSKDPVVAEVVDSLLKEVRSMGLN